MPATKEKKAKAAKVAQPVGLSWDAENLRWVRPGEPDLLGGEGEAVAWPSGKERWPTSASLVKAGGEWVLVDRG